MTRMTKDSQISRWQQSCHPFAWASALFSSSKNGSEKVTFRHCRKKKGVVKGRGPKNQEYSGGFSFFLFEDKFGVLVLFWNRRVDVDVGNVGHHVLGFEELQVVLRRLLPAATAAATVSLSLIHI